MPRAIEDLARAKIMEIPYRQARSADQIATALKKTGYKKALTTVRHHLEILKESGQIEVIKIEESRGAITKYMVRQQNYLISKYLTILNLSIQKS